MVLADEHGAIKLRQAILSIPNFPRGVRRLYDYWNMMFQNSWMKTVEREDLSKFYHDNDFLVINNYFDNEPPFQLEDVLLTGSLSEGTFKFSLKERKFSDQDFMLLLKNIQVTEADQKKGNLPVKENTPFVNLYLTDEDLLKTWSEFLETSCDATCEIAKFSSRKLKSRFRENYTKNSPFGGPLNDETVEPVDDGPSIAVCSKYRWDENDKDVPTSLNHFRGGDIDFVLAIKCNGWPLCAQEWIFRQRCWPSQDLVQTIVKEGFHLVCKSSPEGDFRLSYSNAETVLIGNLNALQFKTYRAFKTFVSYYKKNWSAEAKKAVCSYHLKTIVLWYCEKSDPIDWTEDRIVDHLLSLIEDLILAISEKNLPMYFMPKCNLMERLEDIAEPLEQMIELRLNLNLITKAVIADIPSFLEVANFFLNTFLDGTLPKQLFPPVSLRDGLYKFMEILDKFWKRKVTR